jgi:hypothetical protein
VTQLNPVESEAGHLLQHLVAVFVAV